MEALGRVELPTFGLGNRCSIHLSYRATRTYGTNCQSSTESPTKPAIIGFFPRYRSRFPAGRAVGGACSIAATAFVFGLSRTLV